MSYLTAEQLVEARTLRDLTDPAAGLHCMQELVGDCVAALTAAWQCPALIWRGDRVVDVEDNYDRLGYPADGPARDVRYSRYVGPGRMLRTQTSAAVPSALRALASAPPDDILVVVPGLVWRRDVIDRVHVGAPHQLDLWRVTSGPSTHRDLDAMVAAVVHAVSPSRRWRTRRAEHPYTTAGRQIDVEGPGGWVELLECGLAHPDVLADAGLTGHSGLAMGLGLDRAVMLRKGIDDIRLLRARDPRVARQMRDLTPYRQVSAQPAARRDMSLMCAPDLSAELLGDRVREALGRRADWVEEVAVLSRTPYELLPEIARRRMGARPGQHNLLVRLMLRHPTRSLARAEANRIRDRVYQALHEGRRSEYTIAAVGL